MNLNNLEEYKKTCKNKILIKIVSDIWNKAISTFNPRIESPKRVIQIEIEKHFKKLKNKSLVMKMSSEESEALQLLNDLRVDNMDSLEIDGVITSYKNNTYNMTLNEFLQFCDNFEWRARVDQTQLIDYYNFAHGVL